MSNQACAALREELKRLLSAHHTVNDKDVRGVDELVREVMAAVERWRKR